MSQPTPDRPGALHPLLAQLVDRHGFAALASDTFDVFAEAPGRALIAFTEDPARYKETLDLAVIAGELARAFAGRFRPGVLFAEDARVIAPRFGFRRWPALVMLADGRYVGAIDGLRNWDEYLTEVAQLLDAPPARPPSIGIAVTAAGAGGAACNH